MCQVSRFVKRVRESHPQRSRDAGVPFPRPKAFPLVSNGRLWSRADREDRRSACRCGLAGRWRRIEMFVAVVACCALWCQ